MPSDCLYDYIGLRGLCVDVEPASGSYLNQLAGITLTSMDKVADREQQTFVGVWNDVQTRGIRRFRKDFFAAFMDKYTSYCCTEDCSVDDLICDQKALMVDCLLYVFGNELMIERLYSDRLNSYTTTNRQSAEELKDFYQVEYEKAIKTAVKNIPYDSIKDCFACTGSVKYVERLP